MPKARLIDGKLAAEEIRGQTAAAAQRILAERGFPPGLAVIILGEHAASRAYVRTKTRMAAAAGFLSRQFDLPRETSESELLALIDKLNRTPEIDGIMVQLHLPPQVRTAAVIEAIAPEKDVDGFHAVNGGRLLAASPGQQSAGFVPCTPWGCQMLLRRELRNLAGREAVVVGRSNIVGKPMALLLLNENCTVTLAHSHTRELASVCRRADILVAAVGRPEFVRGDWVKQGAIVLDVGINRIAGEGGTSQLVGDVAFAEAVERAGAITPVPGGIGPMTVACLLANTALAACRRSSLELPAFALAPHADGPWA
jgi:methylenetetrahydrofolate dehydrogenase (NADP+) / methenyltetrahydrofolate cyclohydrolase